MPVHRLLATGVTAQTYQLPADKLLQGNPTHTVWLQYTDASGKFSVGIWHSECGAWRVRYTEEEHCLMLEGCSLITEDGAEPVTVRVGDAFVIPRGFVGTWQVLEPTTKRFVIYEPEAA